MTIATVQAGVLLRVSDNETIKRMAKEIGLPEGTIIRGLLIYALNSGITAHDAATLGLEGRDPVEAAAVLKESLK